MAFDPTMAFDPMMACNLPLVAVNLPEPLELATAVVGHPWHPTKDVILLNGVKYSVSGLLELLFKWGNDADYPDTQVCKLTSLGVTFTVVHYLLGKLYSVPDRGETSLNLSDEEHQKYVDVGHASFREFTRLLKVVENHTLVGPVPVGEETYDGLFVKNLEGSEPMEACASEIQSRAERDDGQRDPEEYASGNPGNHERHCRFAGLNVFV